MSTIEATDLRLRSFEDYLVLEQAKPLQRAKCERCGGEDLSGYEYGRSGYGREVHCEPCLRMHFGWCQGRQDVILGLFEGDEEVWACLSDAVREVVEERIRRGG